MSIVQAEKKLCGLVTDQGKLLKLTLAARVFFDHHRKFKGSWQAKNNSTLNRASMSLPQILKAFSLPDIRENRIHLARMKRELENYGVIHWIKRWDPSRGRTQTRLADEIEPMEIPEEEQPPSLAAVCSVVEEEIKPRPWPFTKISMRPFEEIEAARRRFR